MAKPSQQDFESLLVRVCDIALAAGREIAAIAREIGQVQHKADGTPLTRADKAADAIIAAGLAGISDEPVLSEEGDLAAADFAAARRFWCVDPLDGTKEFIKGLGEYTVNIALIEAGRPVLGVIYAPAIEALYYGAAGVSAARRRPAGAQAEILRPSEADRPRRAVASRSHLSEATTAMMKELGVEQVSSVGSSLKMCSVAAGEAEIYPRVGPTWLWDTAAGTAIARAAGCVVMDLRGGELMYDPRAGLKHEGFVVTARQFEGRVRELLE